MLGPAHPAVPQRPGASYASCPMGISKTDAMEYCPLTSVSRDTAVRALSGWNKTLLARFQRPKTPKTRVYNRQ